MIETYTDTPGSNRALPDPPQLGSIALVIEGFNAIWIEIQRNAERGRHTDIAGLIEKLQSTVRAHTGTEYPLPWLQEMFEFFLANKRTGE